MHWAIVFILTLVPTKSGIIRTSTNQIKSNSTIKDNIYNMENSGHPAWDVCCTGLVIGTHGYVDRDVYYIILIVCACQDDMM